MGRRVSRYGGETMPGHAPNWLVGANVPDRAAERILDESVALRAVAKAYEELFYKLDYVARSQWIWGPSSAVTIVTNWERTWRHVIRPEGVEVWLRSDEGLAWLEEKGKPLDSDSSVFEEVADWKLATLDITGMESSRAAVEQAPAFFRVGMCTYPGAVRFQGFDVSTSGFTGAADEWFSRLVGIYVQCICENIMDAMLEMEHQGLITQEMLDAARKKGLKSI